MAKYTAFLDVGKTLVDMMKDCIVPEPLEKAESIGMCDPKDRGNFVVGVHLYDFAESTELGVLNPIALPNGNIKNPPTPYNLRFMISIASKAEAMVKSTEETRIMGKILQMIGDNPFLPYDKMPESLKHANEQIEVKFSSIDLEEKMKIWSMFNESYKPSIFIDVMPVFIESAIIRKPAQRVTTFATEQTVMSQRMYMPSNETEDDEETKEGEA